MADRLNLTNNYNKSTIFILFNIHSPVIANILCLSFILSSIRADYPKGNCQTGRIVLKFWKAFKTDK